MANAVYEHGGGNWATCPACKGAGVQMIGVLRGNIFSIREYKRKRSRKCLACRNHPGKVETHRVCPVCGQFTDLCICKRHKNISVRKLERIMSDNKTPGNKGTTGVAWDKNNSVWVANISKDGTPVYLGTFKDEEKDLAEGIVMEARRLPVDQIPVLKQQYKALKAQRRAGGQGPIRQIYDIPMSGGETLATEANGRYPALAEAEMGDPYTTALLNLIQAARAADDHARRLADRATQAAEEAQAATQEAIDAWNKVAEALCSVADSSPSFMQSLLGRGGVEHAADA
jgi:hypothetical protein